MRFNSPVQDRQGSCLPLRRPDRHIPPSAKAVQTEKTAPAPKCCHLIEGSLTEFEQLSGFGWLERYR